MPKVELVYFTGCPFVEKAREVLKRAGYNSFTEINTDKLGTSDRNRFLSSPSILVDQKLVIGRRNESAGSCSIVDWNAAFGLLKSYVG